MEILGIPDVTQLKNEVAKLNIEIAKIGSDEARLAAIMGKLMPIQKKEWQKIATENNVHIKEHSSLKGLMGYLHGTLSKKGAQRYPHAIKIIADVTKVMSILEKCKRLEDNLKLLELKAEKETKKSLGIIKTESGGIPIISPNSLSHLLIEEKKEIVLIKTMIENNKKDITELIESLNLMKDAYNEEEKMFSESHLNDLSNELRNDFKLNPSEFNAKLKYAINVLTKEIIEDRSIDFGLNKEEKAAETIIKIYNGFMQKQREETRLKNNVKKITLSIKKIE